MTAAGYQITWLDPYGTPKGFLSGFNRMEFAYGEQTVGALDLYLPRGDYRPEDFHEDQMIEVRRSYLNSPFTLEGERAWFLRTWTFLEESIHLKFYDNNFLVDGRNVLYKTGTAQADETGPADDLIKQVIRENLATLATVTARQLANFTVQPNAGLGPSISKAFSLDKILPLCQTLSGLAGSKGVYITWDVVYTGAGKFEFRTFKNLRGTDHSTGASVITFSKENYNLNDIQYTEDHADEKNYVLVAGKGEAANRAWGEYTAPAATSSPWNRREMVVDGYDSDDPIVLAANAAQVAYQNRAKIIITGTVVQTENFRYNVDYAYGDLVNVSAYGKTAPCRLNTVHVTVDEDNLETIDIKLRGEI